MRILVVEDTQDVGEAIVACLTATGIMNKEIAEHLGVSDDAVKFHLKSIFVKFGLGQSGTRTQMAARVYCKLTKLTIAIVK